MPRLPFHEIEQLIADGAAPGCAVSVSADGDMQSFVCGRTGGAGSAAVTPHTVYDVASITKLFTTALIVQLAGQGKLSLDDRCACYLDNFRDSQLRIIDLLTHRLDFGVAMHTLRAAHPTPDALRETLTRLTPPKLAADSIHYANTEFFFLGLVVEKCTGRSLHDAMTALFRHLDLRHTFTGPDIGQLHIVTPPTEVIDGQTVQGVTHDETARILGGLTGHAGVFSTADDLAQFGRAWLDGRIISSEALRRAVFQDYDPSGNKPQAAGWWLRCPAADGTERPTPGAYMHIGFTGPLLAISPANGRVATFTCNRTYYGRNNRLQRDIWQLLIDWLQV